MGETSFEPAERVMKVDEEVRRKNTSSLSHSVTGYEESIPDGGEYFASGGHDSESAVREAWKEGSGNGPGGEAYSHAFSVPGTYEYFCATHE